MSAEADLREPSGREHLLQSIDPSDVSSADQPTLRRILEAEIVYRGDESHDGEFFENIYHCGLLLYAVGDVEDIPLLWRAKNSTFDTSIGFDIENLFGAGVEATYEYLREHNLDEILDHGGITTLTDDLLAEWFANRVHYFYE